MSDTKQSAEPVSPDGISMFQRPPWGKVIETRTFTGGALHATKTEYVRNINVQNDFEALSVIGQALTELPQVGTGQMTFTVIADRRTQMPGRVVLTYEVERSENNAG